MKLPRLLLDEETEINNTKYVTFKQYTHVCLYWLITYIYGQLHVYKIQK